MTSRISLFHEQGFVDPPFYGAEDISKLLQSSGLSFSLVDHNGLENISRKTCDILVLPYISGEFSRTALEAMLSFHSAGGSLFFLGDLPHSGKWYPLRNMLAYKFHLTRCYDDMNISSDRPEIRGLTAKGKEILGELKDFEFIEGKTFPVLRVTAFPPDLAYPLLRINSSSHAQNSSAVVAVERKCPKFLGAKFAMMGFIGGEPRENADGAYQKEWKYDPGLLTRDWGGINDMVLKLIDWLKPSETAATLSFDPVIREGSKESKSLLLKNLADFPQNFSRICVKSDSGKLCEFKGLKIAPQETKILPLRGLPPSKAGIVDYKVTALPESQPNANLAEIELDCQKQRIYPKRSSTYPGFGFSTYWAFKNAEISDEFKYFCSEMKRRGAQYIRTNIPWEDIEPSPKNYDWRVCDELLNFAEEEELLLKFWLFPTTRGSGLADGGVPWWSLKEPAIDRYGNKGFFPSIWSPFYREHYFGMVEELTRRYSQAKALSSFIIDFGNSDFPYGYYYYGGDNTIFDYSEFEHSAFANYLKNELNLCLEDLSKLFSRQISSFEEVKVPFSEEKQAFSVYLDFRTWSIREGIRHIQGIVRRNSPSKLPPDLPGHGLGSISDLSTYFYEAKARHWNEEKIFDEKLVVAHNCGKEWGGEAWQVGGDFRQYDDALFQSVRLNANYFSIPGADLGLHGEDIARIGYVRRTLMGALRDEAELAVFDKIAWNDFNSYANIATRLDFPTDLLYSKSRFDFSCYKLLVLPPDDNSGGTVTGGGAGQLLPHDEAWYWLLRLSVEKGLRILVFPKTCEIRKSGIQRTFLRQVFGIQDIEYSEASSASIEYPGSFGGGSVSGRSHGVISDGKVLLHDEKGRPVLVEKRFGKGALLLAGFDNSPGSIDKAYNYEENPFLGDHFLPRISAHLGIVPKKLRTNGLFAYKEIVRKGSEEYLLLFSHCKRPVDASIEIKLLSSKNCAVDLSSGQKFELKKLGGNWRGMQIVLNSREGRYLSFE